MGKTKTTDSKKEKKSQLASVKAGRVEKPAQTPKAKSKDIAKSAVKEKKKSKKAKTPTPEPESESESSASDAEDDSSDSSEDEKVEKKTTTKVAAKAESSDSDSDSSDSEEEAKPAAKANGVKTNGAAKAAPKDDSSDSDDSDSDSASEDEKPAAKAVKAKAETSDSESGSDSSADSDSDEEEAPSKKRKAEAAAEPAVKKTKTEAPASEGIKNLFVGSLSWNIDEDWLRREFEHFGDITGCRVITDRESGRSKGFGYVEFASADDAAKAKAEMHEYELDGRPLNVDFSTPREKPDQNARANKYGDKRSAPANTLFLGNLSFDCTNDGIQEIFAEYGNITRVSLPTDRDTGALKGFGYVDFGTTEEATAALEALNGQEVEGRAIRIDYAAPRADNGGGGGFGGGRGGGGRGGGRGGFGGGRGGGRGGFGDRGGRGGGRGRGGDRGGRGGFGTNRGGFGDFKGQKKSFD